MNAIITRETTRETFGQYDVIIDTTHVDFNDSTYKVTVMVWCNVTNQVVHNGTKNYGSTYAALAAMSKKFKFDI
jgi:hypothetical protein